MTPILFNVHQLPVSSRFIYKILLLTFKSLSGLAPSYFSDFLLTFPLDHFNHLDVNVFVYRDFVDHLWVAGLSLLGLLSFGAHCPVSRSITTLHEFKCKHKTKLFNQYYQSKYVSS